MYKLYEGGSKKRKIKSTIKVVLTFSKKIVPGSERRFVIMIFNGFGRKWSPKATFFTVKRRPQRPWPFPGRK